ncbi:MAG: bifunctional phosphopantothenoylcysteine decarboxylase/phosphopantothenate--cysteine ligase CoaBC [Spirochaetales bacterium]|nr:bifunctional phosphopantothenoylcysteine decarboxylase/phosphopantothenate--cysteine ligase CoaBC [Spirochaetales bacterium]
MHISKDIIGSVSQILSGKKITLGLTGSVAVTRIVDLARLLMRHGAEVYPVFTKSAKKLIQPRLLYWATGNKPVVKLTGLVEHVALCGNVPGKSDILLIAPASANTIGKIAAGIDDTPVTTCATSAMGEGIPVIVVPAMHESMYHHPVVVENIEKLKKLGVKFIDSKEEEGKAKIADNQEIVNFLISLLSQKTLLKGKNIIISAGPTVESIDPVRVISNRSSGKMGMALAEAALNYGASVTLVHGPCRVKVPHGALDISVESTAEMKNVILDKIKKADIFISAAAVSDYQLDQSFKTKISTDNPELVLKLIPTPKIIDEIKKHNPNIFLVAFRALTDLDDNAMIDNAFKRLKKASADLIIANDVQRPEAGFDVDTNEVIIIDKNKQIKKIDLSSKKAIANKIIETIIEKLDIHNHTKETG